MQAADFFSGLGGFTEGARQAGLEVTFACNHWAEACRWHEANHGGRIEQQDLQQLDMRLLPDLSSGLLLASPACQGHSQNAQPARKGTGGSHPPDPTKATQRTILQRSTSWAVLAAAEEARPHTIIVENVPDFLRWTLYHSWRGALETLGYHVRDHVLNAANYGSAQDRNRAIITARLGTPLRLEGQYRTDDMWPLLGNCIDKSGPYHRWSTISSKSERMKTRMRKAQNEAGSLCCWNNVSESSGRPLDGLAPTLTTKSGSQLYLLDGGRCRILNPRELARIQSFPEHYKIPSNRELASKLIGNAIDVRMARGIVEQALN
jgi:DNA (cytosine-5)-methyltransferase 1